MERRLFWENRLIYEDSSSSDDEQRDLLRRERRQYKMTKRISLEKWDDIDFAFRFRLSKHTFGFVLSLIENQLEHVQPRYIIYCSAFRFRLMVILFSQPTIHTTSSPIIDRASLFCSRIDPIERCGFFWCFSRFSVPHIGKSCRGNCIDHAAIRKNADTDEEMPEACKDLLWHTLVLFGRIAHILIIFFRLIVCFL